MLKPDFDRPIDRTNTGSLKWSRYAGRDVLPLWVADMDFVSPPCVLEALRTRVEHGVFGYSVPTPSLNQAIVDYLWRSHGVNISADWLVWLPGCVPALSLACAAAGEPGDHVVTITPVYPPFLHVHKDSGRTLTAIPLAVQSDGSHELDWEALQAAITPKTRVLLFCNPHNPVGKVYSPTEVSAVVQFCARNNLVLCSDEIHCDLILDETVRHTMALSVAQSDTPRTITIMGASKTYNIAGLACAFVIIPDAGLRRQFQRAGGKLISEVNPMGYVATEAAYREGESWRQSLLAYLRKNWTEIVEFSRQKLPGIRLAPLQATYLAWLDLRTWPVEDPIAYLEKHGLGLSQGRDFGAPGFARLNFGCPRALLIQALHRLAAAAKGLGPV